MRKLRFLWTALFVLLTAGCDEFSPGIKGSGKVITEPRTVSGFNAVLLKGAGALTIEENGTESLTISADDNLLPYVTAEVSGGRLTLSTKDNTSISPSFFDAVTKEQSPR